MKTADLNRLSRAGSDLAIAQGRLNAIKWEGVSQFEYELLTKAKRHICDAQDYLADIKNIQIPKP